MPNKVFTAPLAIIRAGAGGTAIGKIRNLQFQENIQRGEVQGLGALCLSEVPVTSIRCQFNASSYLISLKKLGNVNDPFWPVDATDPVTMANALLLGEKGVTIQIFKKVPKGIALEDMPQGHTILRPDQVNDEYTFAVVPNCFINSRSWEISEGNIAGKNLSGIYLEPIYTIGQ